MWNTNQPHDPLSILKTSDHFRNWASLEDKRVCVVCGRTFRGHEVQMVMAGDQYKLRCPTRGCESGIHQWVYTGNPLISEAAYAEWWRALSAAEALHAETAPASVTGV